tara:strand:- start:18 stop:629 length:612 start_codon:yes stop_codon:yes gene_type:complete
MYKYEAHEITGGLSAPNKMPGPSINLPTTACIVGTRLRDVKGSTCSGCYAHERGRYRFKNVKEAQNRRLAKLRDPRWIEAMVTLIDKQPVFRWHDAGDLQAAWHLKNIFEVCNRTPGTAHWLPTRESPILKEFQPEVVPKNLKIVLSDHMNDQSRGASWWPYTSGVSTDHDQVTCPASSQGNKCRDCRKCWDKSVKRVIYPKH